MDQVPENAILFGHDGTDEVYVGQAFYEGILLPAQINPNQDIAIVLYETGVQEVEKYTFVCGPAEWVPWTRSQTSAFPDNVIVGGHVVDIVSRSSLCFGRGVHNGISVMGQVSFDHNFTALCHGLIVHLEEYDILVRKCVQEDPTSNG